MWLNPNVADTLVAIVVFEAYQQDRQSSAKKTGGDVVTSIVPGQTNMDQFSHTKCLALTAEPLSIILSFLDIGVVITDPFANKLEINLFYSFPPFLVSMVSGNLYIPIGDFNHATVNPLIVFDLTDQSISPNRGNSTLDRISTIHRELFCLKLGAPVSTKEHCLLLSN